MPRDRTTPSMEGDRPTTFRTFSDPDSLRLSSTHATDDSEEKLVFPNPAISVLSAVTRHAKKTCKSLVKVSSTSSLRSRHHEKPPNMAKMRMVTPVYDHDLEKWVFPDHVIVDDDDQERRYSEGQRRKRHSVEKGKGDRSSSYGGSGTSLLGSISSRGSSI